MGKRYKLTKIKDILEVPPEQFEHFLVDLTAYYRVNRSIIDIGKSTGEIAAVVIGDGFTWIDDGKHDITARFSVSTEDKQDA